MQYSISVVRDLALLLEQSGLHEISFATQSESETPLKIVVRAAPRPTSRPRRATPVAASESAMVADVNAAPIHSESARDTELGKDEIALLEAALAPQAVSISATAVGLFSLALDVEIGTHVKKNQVVAYVESMKIPTEVRAPQNGTIHEVFAESGQGVEWGQSLLSLIAES